MNGTGPEKLSEQAYISIREWILRGQFPVGSALSRRKLAVTLGISQLPVSEALQRLESDGLVERKPRAGTRVRIPTAEDVRDSYIIREALESQSARLFALRATPRERREVRRMAEHTDVLFNRCVQGGTDPEFLFEVHTYHLQLHTRIAEGTRSAALVSALEKNQVLIFNWLFDITARHQKRPPRFHRELAEVVCGNDPEAADAAMRRHIRFGLDEMIEMIRQQANGGWRKAADPRGAAGRAAGAPFDPASH